MIKRKIDGTGRIVIPKDLMKSLKWEEGTQILFAEQDGSLVLTKAEPTCICCKNEENLMALNQNVFLCRSCFSAISKR